MTLRIKLAIGAALLSALVAGSVATLGYISTKNTVTNNARQSVNSLLSRFDDPDGRLVQSLCASGSQDHADIRNADSGLLGGAPGITLDCIDNNGAIVASIGPNFTENLPVPNCSSAQHHAVQTQLKQSDDDDYIVGTFKTNQYCVAALRNLNETKGSLSTIRNELIALSILTTIIAALLGSIAARRATAPVLALTRVAEHISSTDDLSASINASGKDEVGRLSRSLAKMLSSLRHSREQEQRFVQDAGHELRTPLTSIRTNVDTLARHDDLDNATKHQIIDDVRSEIDEMSALIEELVILGAADENVVLQNVDLDELITSVIDRWRRRTNATINVNTISAITMSSNPALLSRAFSNLLDNALKFGQSKPIDVTLDGTSISVRDHGSGVALEDLDHIFDRFYRSPFARSESGSGLGLAIVRETLRRINGTVSVQNHPDGGAIFTINLEGEPSP